MRQYIISFGYENYLDRNRAGGCGGSGGRQESKSSSSPQGKRTFFLTISIKTPFDCLQEMLLWRYFPSVNSRQGSRVGRENHQSSQNSSQCKNPSQGHLASDVTTPENPLFGKVAGCTAQQFSCFVAHCSNSCSLNQPQTCSFVSPSTH